MIIDANLAEAMEKSVLTRLEKSSLEKGHFTGYVIDATDELVLILVVGDLIRFNGFSVLRVCDLSSIEVPAPNREFVEQALRVRGEEAESAPRMEFDRPLGIGATGGHGPIGYSVEEYMPGQSIRFRFTKPKGFNGFHRFEVIEQTESSVVLRHTIEMSTHGLARLTWPLMIRPLHDALIEDAFATAQASLGQELRMDAWSLWVKVLRWIMSGGKVPRQVVPKKRMRREAEA